MKSWNLTQIIVYNIVFNITYCNICRNSILDFRSHDSHDQITCCHKPGVCNLHNDMHHKCQSGQWEYVVCNCWQNRVLTKKAHKKADSSFQKFESSEISSISFVYVLLELQIYCIELLTIFHLATFITLFNILYKVLITGFTVLISLLSEKIICWRWLELLDLHFFKKTQKTLLLSSFKMKWHHRKNSAILSIFKKQNSVCFESKMSRIYISLLCFRSAETETRSDDKLNV